MYDTCVFGRGEKVRVKNVRVVTGKEIAGSHVHFTMCRERVNLRCVCFEWERK